MRPPERWKWYLVLGAGVAVLVTLFSVFQFTRVGDSVCIPPAMGPGTGPQYSCAPALSPILLIGVYLTFALGVAAIVVALIGLRRMRRWPRAG